MKDTENQQKPEPYQPQRRFDRQDGKQPFGYKGFCALCGTYRRTGLTRADYLDPVGQFRTSGLVCDDCFSQIAEAETDDEEDDEMTTT